MTIDNLIGTNYDLLNSLFLEKYFLQETLLKKNNTAEKTKFLTGYLSDYFSRKGFKVTFEEIIYYELDGRQTKGRIDLRVHNLNMDLFQTICTGKRRVIDIEIDATLKVKSVAKLLTSKKKFNYDALWVIFSGSVNHNSLSNIGGKNSYLLEILEKNRIPILDLRVV